MKIYYRIEWRTSGAFEYISACFGINHFTKETAIETMKRFKQVYPDCQFRIIKVTEEEVVE